MYLKRLEIQGFKSFADKISLDFASGITSVVGPNGSGKSNIADAMRWVLGEQSAKTLRGTKMEDIIFIGTEHRKPLGFAEVNITIDNSDKMLPVEYNEVTVTRRVYRSGESEYLLNKTICRLKDIHELFLDTGIGKDGYSIIGQGRVDEILSTKSEDRRHIFEEASGIVKYKVRKIEAEKKLEQAEQNLLRINDILSELELQLEPLRQQSETAKKYLSLRDVLRELEVNVYIDQIGKFKEKIKEFETSYLSIKENIDEENQKLDEITEKNKSKTEMLKKLEDRLESARQEFYSIDGILERSTSEINLNLEKQSNLTLNNDRLGEEINEMDEKVAHLNSDGEKKSIRIQYLKDSLKDFEKKLLENEARLNEVILTLSDAERNIENLKSSIMDKLDLLSDKKTQVNNVKNHIENLKRRQISIDGETLSIQLEKDRENMKKEDLCESIRIAKENMTSSKQRLSNINAEKEKNVQGLNNKREMQSKLIQEINFKSNRKKILSDMEKNLEGYNRSVKQVLMACESDVTLSKGIHGALAQLITVDKACETAIEMVLGGALQNIVTNTEEDAKRAIEYLKRNNLGRATFLPISAVNGRSFDQNMLLDIKKHKGFVGVASDLLTYNQEIKGIILNLLGKTIVVENLDDGVTMARAFRYNFRIVTLDGDILSTSGSMAGGSKDTRSSGILSRSREILELEEAITVATAENEGLSKDISILTKSVDDLIQMASNEEILVRNHELIKIRDESHLTQIEENINRYIARVEMLIADKNQLKSQEIGALDEQVKVQDELTTIEEEIATTKAIVSKHQDKHKEDQTVRDALHRDVTDFKISVNSIKESLDVVSEALLRINEEKESLTKGYDRRIRERDKNLDEIKSLNEKNNGLTHQMKMQEEVRVTKNLEIDGIVEEKRVFEVAVSDIIERLTTINKNILLMQEEFNRIEVKKAKMEAEMDAIQNRMWDEYELTYTNAIVLKKDIGGIPQAQKQIHDIRNDIKNLGPINVVSIEEYIKTKERFEFMSAQKEDVTSAKEKLHKVIHEMTIIMKKQFLEQFRLINNNFNIVFKELFDGGHAELILIDKDNALESGIEIEAQPPGKKLQNMMLLSGGERAFTAIALLFSILRLKPTPFCILDEIEAALDDANVYRFGQYLKRFTNQTQFVMITHRKGTMEVADTLYGVTMQEHGISKVVSMKLGEIAS